MSAHTPSPLPERHAIVRVRHEIVRRKLVVGAVEQLTPRMRRVRFASPELAGFVSTSPDDHVKVFFPTRDGAPAMRDFTPRAFDAATNELTLDFALHGGGVASAWAEAAKVGDTLEIGGPRGSLVVTDDFDWYLFVGDESALPAIGRFLETLREGVPVATIVALASDDEAQTPPTRTSWTPRWIARGEPSERDAEALRDACRAFTPPAGDGFVWIAGEDAIVRTVRTHFVDERGHDTAWMKGSAYWHRARADAH